MKAAVLHGPDDLRIEEIPWPEPGPGEVVLKVDAALTGGTAAKFVRRGYHHRMGRPPVQIGHEGAGTIHAIGEGVETHAVGDRVVPANSASCGTCTACIKGLTAQCTDMVWLRGLFAEATVVPARIVRTNLHRLPDGLDPITGALAENLACVLKGRDRTPVRAGECAVVLGAGPLGLLWTRVLSLTGVEVTTIDPRPSRRVVAEALGASMTEDAATFAARAATGAVAADLVVEAVGRAAAWQTALEAAGPGGRVHLFGGPPRDTQVRIDTERLHYDELMVVSSFHHTPYHFAEAVRALAHGLLDVNLLVTERVDLDALPDLLRRQADGEGPLKGALLFD